MVVARLDFMGSSSQTSRTISCPAGVFQGVLLGDSVVFDPIIYAYTPPFSNEHNTAGNGDPLQLCITIPVTAGQLNDLPVVVVIHGGRYESGSYTEPWFSGNTLAKNNVITVSVEYRLALAGFLPFPDDEPHHFRGVDDVTCALLWLQDNIESFGGDPTNMTVVGHSSGAGMALWLCRKDHYQGLFRRVVALSPAFPRKPFNPKKAKLRRILGKPVTRKTLSRLPKEQLAASYQRFSRSVRSDIAIGTAPFAAYELAEVPLLLSCTREEMLDMPLAKRLDSSWWGRLVVPFLRSSLGANSAWSPPFAARTCGYLIGDCMIRRFVLSIADTRPHNTWLVEHQGTITDPIKHCDDIEWVFGLSEVLHPLFAEFLAFIRTGSVSWPCYGTEKIAQLYHRVPVSASQAATASPNEPQSELTTDPLGYLREGLR